MVRDMGNPDRRGKDMDMGDTRTYYCVECDRREGQDHTADCEQEGTVGDA